MNPANYTDENKKIVNVPDIDLPIEPITAEEIKQDEERSLKLINTEFKHGFDFVQKYDKTVTFFGSARFSPEDEHSKEAEAIAKKIVTELNYGIITGGGPGIMQAANKGASEAGGVSLGLTIKLPREQVTNPYVKEEVGFYYFFTRKTIMTFAAEAFIFFPGGFGTLDEFFDILTLVQTRKIPQVPIILVGRDFWEPLNEFIKKNMMENHKAVSAEEMKLYTITDDHDEIVKMIKEAPVSKWWKNYEM